MNGGLMESRIHRLWRLRWARLEFGRAELPPDHPAHDRLREAFDRADALHEKAKGGSRG